MFFKKKKKGLSKEEQNNIISKLRSEYLDYSSEFGKRIFDLDAFEDRLNTVINKKYDLNSFLFSEITTLEQIKEKVEEKRKPKEKAFMNQVNKIMEKNLKKIENYPDFIIHEKASHEVNKLLGALRELEKKAFYPAESVIRSEQDPMLLNQMKKIDILSQTLLSVSEKKLAPRIDDHYLLLIKPVPDHKYIELDEKRMIKDIALFLNDYKSFLEQTLQKNKIHEPDKKLKQNKTPGQSGNLIKSKKEILMESIYYINQILKDFRIESFKRQ